MRGNGSGSGSMFASGAAAVLSTGVPHQMASRSRATTT
jgi:hypothetical protein